MEAMLKSNLSDFQSGQQVLKCLIDGKVYLCVGSGSSLKQSVVEGVEVAEFSGLHFAGLAGIYIHYLAPASRNKIAWHIHYQDVVALGQLFTTGQIYTECIILVAGPAVSQSMLVKTRWGASTVQLCRGRLNDEENRIIFGSVLCGHTAADDLTGYLSRFDLQVSVLNEGREREFIGWLSSGLNKYSLQ